MDAYLKKMKYYESEKRNEEVDFIFIKYEVVFKLQILEFDLELDLEGIFDMVPFFEANQSQINVIMIVFKI